MTAEKNDSLDGKRNMFLQVSIVFFVSCAEYFFSPGAIIRIAFHTPRCAREIAAAATQPIFKMTVFLNT